VELAFHLADDEVDVLEQPSPGLDVRTEQSLTQQNYTVVTNGTVKVCLSMLIVGKFEDFLAQVLIFADHGE
jgi:hypothetical protein